MPQSAGTADNQERYAEEWTSPQDQRLDEQKNTNAGTTADEPCHEDEVTETSGADIENAQQHDVDDKPFSVYTHNEKKIIVSCAGLCAFFSPISGQIYFPSLPAIARDLNVSYTLVTLTITIYLVSPNENDHSSS
jgi:hypothetical protein